MCCHSTFSIEWPVPP